MRVTLREFIENFVCPNSIIRLWTPLEDGSGNKLLIEDGKELLMEWEVLSHKVPQSKYLNYPVKGVTDILTENTREAINIVIMLDEDFKEYFKEYHDKLMKRNKRESADVVTRDEESYRVNRHHETWLERGDRENGEETDGER